jgi:hypothetical protein
VWLGGGAELAENGLVCLLHSSSSSSSFSSSSSSPPVFLAFPLLPFFSLLYAPSSFAPPLPTANLAALPRPAPPCQLCPPLCLCHSVSAYPPAALSLTPLLCPARARFLKLSLRSMRKDSLNSARSAGY